MSGKLLWLTQNYYPQKGGMAQSCERIVTGLRRLGWQIDLVHFSSRWSTLQAQRKFSGYDIRCPVDDDISHTMNQLWCALPSIGLKTYDAVVAFGGYLPMLSAPVYAAWLQLPLVTLIRGNDFDAAIFDPKRSGMLEQALCSSAKVAVVSGDKVTKIERLWPQAKVEWIPNGIDFEGWQPIQPDRQQASEWRQSWLELSGKTHLLGLFGQIKRKKGGDYFLEALLRSGAASKSHLLIVGEMESGLQETLDQNPDAFSYTHIPFAERYQLLPYYLACDYVCIPSYYDGMPNVMLEALALGIPLLASYAGGMADMLVDGVHGYLFAPGNVDACVQAILRAINVSEPTKTLISQAEIELVKNELSLARELASYQQLFAEVLGVDSPAKTSAVSTQASHQNQSASFEKQ